ncbi:MAG: opacity protein-like surface antigen [Verrucomicrobiales bacterium]|jgi:opacity protein-like surface antigen
MKCRHFFIGASLSLAVQAAHAGPPFGKNGFGKNYGKEPVLELSVEEVIPSLPSRNRIGVLAIGGLGISAEFISNAFTKEAPKVPISQSEDADFSPGGEIFYDRILSAPSEAANLWGVRVGLGYSQIEVEERFRGIDGGDNPFTILHEFEADLIHLNVGPFYEHRFSDRFYAQVSAGITAAYIDADLETSGVLNAKASEDEFLFGAYASLALGVQIAPNWSLIGGIRYHYIDAFEIDNGATKTELDFDSSHFVFAGLRFDF